MAIFLAGNGREFMGTSGGGAANDIDHFPSKELWLPGLQIASLAITTFTVLPYTVVGSNMVEHHHTMIILEVKFARTKDDPQIYPRPP